MIRQIFAQHEKSSRSLRRRCTKRRVCIWGGFTLDSSASHFASDKLTLTGLPRMTPTPNPHQAHPPRVRTPRSQHTKNGYVKSKVNGQRVVVFTPTVPHVTMIANRFQPHSRAKCHKSGCVVRWRTRCGLGPMRIVHLSARATCAQKRAKLDPHHVWVRADC